MTDVAHLWGADIQIGPTGDLAIANGIAFGQQRVLRRLLTNARDYIWQLDYGAGLPAMIGEPVHVNAIQAIALGQMLLEGGVARTPAPSIEITPTPAGTVYMHVRYADAQTGETVTLSAPV